MNNYQENMDQEINRKRKNNHDFQIPRKIPDIDDQDDNDFLTLSLSFRPTRPRGLVPPPPLPLPPPPPPPQPFSFQALLAQPLPQHPFQLSPSHPFYTPSLTHVSDSPISLSSQMPVMYPRQEIVGPSRPLRVRRNPTQFPREGKSSSVPAPFSWATTQRATVHTLNYLLSRQIVTVKGEVQCKRCEQQYEIEYDIREKFLEVGSFIMENKGTMHDRAPIVWMNPVLPICKFCDQENSAKPLISEKKKSINWLFLLLGQMLGCCTLEQLKYFCKHTKNHRTGAKDRVLYLTYLGLCKQLDPNGPFDRN